MIIRKYRAGDELELYGVFYASVHNNAIEFYEEDQLEAWAPSSGVNKEEWIEKIQKNNPFIIAENGIIFGYADLQENGYIDHFFVCGKKSRIGIGQKLMEKILETAREKNIQELTSNVSLAAQKFFANNGFQIKKR